MKLFKHPDYGYYKIVNGLIYYYDDDKNLEKIKIYNN